MAIECAQKNFEFLCLYPLTLNPLTPFFLVKPDVETGVGFLKMVDFEIVDQNIRKDGAEMLGRFHSAKIAPYS